MIDVIISVAPKDYPKLRRCVRGVLDNSETPVGNIFLLTADDGVLCALDRDTARRVSVVRERDMPFAKSDIERLLEFQNASRRQASWYYQQLLKLYVFEAIGALRNHALIVDADFAFCRPVRFLTDDGATLLSRGYPFKWLLNTRHYPAQVDHVHVDFARRLVRGWEPTSPFSGMHHHMVLRRDVVTELFDTVERAHRQPFWLAFTSTVRLDKWDAASEYILYYHFAIARHPESVVVRDLKTCDIIHDADHESGVLEEFDKQLAADEYDAVGCHGFLDLRSRLATMDYIPRDLKTEFLRSRATMFLLRLENAALRIKEVV